MKFRKRIFAVVVAGTAGVLAVAPLAASSPDTTPPTLKTPIKSSWVTNSQISSDYVVDCRSQHSPGDGIVWVRADQQFKWNGADNSGYVRYSILTQLNTGEEQDQDQDLGTQTSYTASVTNANQECGGGNGYVSDWDVTARDAAGNTTTKNVRGGLFALTQETGNADDSLRAVRPTITYAGSWANAYCACWSNGAVRKTTAPGASATITIDLASSGSEPVTHVGLVMHRGPDRGQFKVYLDGTASGTVDLKAATSSPRSIVWQATLDATTVHTVKIVNSATSGRPRIDLDGVLTN